jgi:hypothetical protein
MPRRKTPFREQLREATNTRMAEIRPYMHDHVANLQALEYPVTLRDGYSGLRYLARFLYRMGDPVAIMETPNEDLHVLLDEGIIGAARYRLESSVARLT